MPYDVEVERYVRDHEAIPHRSNEPPPSKDLEAIVTLLEVAALSLTVGPGTTFSRDALLRAAQDIAGEEFPIDEHDAKLVLEKTSFVKGSVGAMSLR